MTGLSCTAWRQSRPVVSAIRWWLVLPSSLLGFVVLAGVI